MITLRVLTQGWIQDFVKGGAKPSNVRNTVGISTKKTLCFNNYISFHSTLVTFRAIFTCLNRQRIGQGQHKNMPETLDSHTRAHSVQSTAPEVN